MDILQSWLIVGVPALLLIAAMFVGSSIRRAWIGYVVLAATVVFFVVVPRDGVSAAIVGLVGVVLVANGRGTGVDSDRLEHHQNRKRMTTHPSSAP